MPQQEILQKIKSIVRAQLSPEYKLFLFGSRAMGTASNVSDYDIGIEGPEEVPFSILSSLQNAMSDLNIFQSVDIVDFTSVEDDFYTIATKKRLWIN